MKWHELLVKVASEPVFNTGFLLAGSVDPAGLRRQFSRWVASGRLLQLRRGWYVLAEPYRKLQPHPFLVANRLKKASYVSLQSALAEYGLIPEHVPVVTSVTTGRPEELRTPLGAFLYRHVKPSWFCGYTRRDLGQGQAAFVATPEMALLDLLYLTPRADDRDYLRELRLQNLDRLNPEALRQLAARSGSAKSHRAVKRLLRLREVEGSEPL
jgi:predicted transcriptional regulator of viral defense system